MVIHDAAKDALEVHGQRKQYGSINCAFLEDHGDRQTKTYHPLRLLAEIALDDRIVEYITEIFIGHCEFGLYEDAPFPRQGRGIYLEKLFEQCEQ